MNQLLDKNIICPYCVETIKLVIDCSIPDQEYIEDCEVCCRPINLFVSINENGAIDISPKYENES